MALLEVRNLVKHFPVRGGLLQRVVGAVHAVNGVSFDVHEGEVLGVVGESGCGKSTLGKLIMRLIDTTSGSIRYADRDLVKLNRRELLPIRRQLQMVFQDPNSSLNPRMTIGGAIREVVRFHRIVPENEVQAYVDQLLKKVGMRPDDQEKYPHEFSGGQKQRVGIARALAVKPKLIVADEPVSALDVSIQAQVLNLLADLKDEYALTMMFISHDLKVINHFCDRMIVMYLGFIVETMPCTDMNAKAQHPYTRALLGANPIPDPERRKKLAVLKGDVPSPYSLPKGCPFASRCPLVSERCREENPSLESIGDQHSVACWNLTNPAG